MNWEEYSNNRPKTIFCDIDGTLVEHDSPLKTTKPGYKLKLLPGALDKLKEWDMKGYRIILITGRRKSLRDATERQLQKAGIFYDDLVMGFSGGERILINDKKLNSEKDTTFAINVERNKGIEDVKI